MKLRIGYSKTAEPEKYGAVILSEGLSSGMDEFKPLLYVDGRTVIAGLVETLRGAGVEDILVVTGHKRDELLPELDRLRVDEAYNEDYEEGMFTSIKTGLAKATEAWPDKNGFFLVTVDCPLVSIDTIRTVASVATDVEAEASRQRNNGFEGKESEPTGITGPEDPNGSTVDRFVVPTYEGKKGHPLLIPASRIEEILAYDGPEGLKGVIEREPDGMISVPVNDEGCVMEMDAPEGYEDIVAFVGKGFRRDKLSVLAGRKRVILVRHGETEQHDAPMFIGQYDVALSDEGRGQAAEAAKKIIDIIESDVTASAGWVEGVSVGKEPLPPLEKIWCSDLSRAKETAEIIAGNIREHYASTAEGPDESLSAGADLMGMFPKTKKIELDPQVTAVEGLREISLGDWDGRSIEEIRREYPEEYRRRGQDLFTFKIGNDSENFYDLQYRAVKALRGILASDDSRNIIIVGHSGTIRAIENNLKGKRVDDEWEPVEKGEVRIWESPPVP